MGRHDWYRSAEWNSTIEAAFYEKLRRARDKAQYLRIQACCLANTNPEVALRLLDEYFALGEHLDIAQAYVDRATAYQSLRQFDAAVDAYESAIAREACYPNVKTQACVGLPYLVGKERLHKYYNRAIEVLDSTKQSLVFPIARFQWNCALALIRSEQGDEHTARDAARNALAASAESHSGFRYHPNVGLVDGIDDAIIGRLKKLAEEPRWSVWSVLSSWYH